MIIDQRTRRIFHVKAGLLRKYRVLAVAGILFFSQHFISPGARANMMPLGELGAIGQEAGRPRVFCDRLLEPLSSNEVQQLNKEIKKRSALKNDDAQKYYERAEALVNQTKDKEAVKSYTQAIEISPDFIKAYLGRARANARLNNHTLAIQDFNRTVELDPHFAKGFFYRGYEYSEIGNFNMALKDYRKALSLDDKDACTYNNIGLIYQARGQYQEALTYYARALEVDPTLEKAKTNQANLLAYLKRA